MKQLLTLILLLFVSKSTIAQEDQTFEFSYGEPFPYKYIAWQQYTVDTPNQQLLLFRRLPQLYSFKLTLKEAQYKRFDGNSLNQEVFNEDLMLEKTQAYWANFEYQGKNYILYADNEKGGTDLRLFLRQFDLQKGQPMGDPRRLIGNDDLYYFEEYWIDEDGEHINIATRQAIEDEDDPIRFVYYRFNKNFEPVSEMEVELPNAEPRVENFASCYRNNEVYSFRSRVVGADEDEGKMGSIEWQLAILDIAKKTTRFIKVPTPQYLPLKGKLRLTNDQKLILTGLYTHDENRKNIKKGIRWDGLSSTYVKGKLFPDGPFAYAVDLDGNLLYQKYHAIPLDLLKMYESKQNRNTLEKLEKDNLSTLVCGQYRDSRPQADGSTIITAEVEFSVSSNGKSYDFSNGIFVFKIGKEGDLLWMSRIPKRQMSNHPYFTMEMCGYKMIEYNQKLYFFFVDASRNDNLEKDDLPSRFDASGGGRLCLYIIDQQTGTKKTCKILNTRDHKKHKVSRVSPHSIIHMGNGKIIMNAKMNNKNSCLVSFQLP